MSLMIAYNCLSGPKTLVWPGLRNSVLCIVNSITSFTEDADAALSGKKA